MIGRYNIIYNLLSLKGIGTVQANKILLSIGERINDLNDNELIIEISQKLDNNHKVEFEKFEHIYPNRTKVLDEIKFSFITDESYPLDLKSSLSKNTPTVISYFGNLDLINRQRVGFCGSRKASAKGLEVAKDCVEQLVSKGAAIVSGYAAGVDQETHYTALKNGGTTIIILPEGIEAFRIKKELKDVWDWNRVLVISEFFPNSIWSAGRAMQRNNTIIGLSDIMILIEAGETGGSMEAGKKTLELKKYLFAPVYEGMPPTAIGNRILLEKGAFPLKKSAQTMKANLTKIFEFLDYSNKYKLL